MLKLSLALIVLPLTTFAQNLFSDPWQPFGARVHLGVLLGTNLTDDVKTFQTNTFKFSGNRQIIVGPTVEFDLGRQFAIEADALYRPIQVEITVFASGALGGGSGFILDRFETTSNTWEFPVLAKKYFPIRGWRPFVAGGPSFCNPDFLSGLSHYGITAAGGAEFHWRRLRVAPSVRYTHWKGEEGAPFSGSIVNRDQSEILVGFSF